MRAVQILVAVCLLVACSQAEDESPYYKPIRACGARLAQTLHEVCLPFAKKADEPKKPLTLVQECCEKTCNVDILRKYCSYVRTDP